MRELSHVHDDVVGWVLDNVGHARRLPTPYVVAPAAPSVNARANTGTDVDARVGLNHDRPITG